MRDYEELTSEWEELLEVLRCGHADLGAVKRVSFWLTRPESVLLYC